MKETRRFSIWCAIWATLMALTDGEHLLVDKLRTDLMDLEGKLWQFVLWRVPSDYGVQNAELYVIRRFKAFDDALKQMPKNTLRGTEPISKIHPYLYLYADVRQMENLYDKFVRFLDCRIESSKSTDKNKLHQDNIRIDDIIGDILNPQTGANATVNKVYNLTFGSENMAKDVLELLMKHYPCRQPSQSPQQIYYNLYNSIALNGLKSYAMIQFAYLANRITPRSKLDPSFTVLSDEAKAQFEKRVNETSSMFRGLMEIVPKELWKCDPATHEKGKTYDEFTRLLQGHIQNEVDMGKGGSCREDCSTYHSTFSQGCYDSDSKYCKETERCNGRLLNCQFFESHMDICPSKNPSRRYDYVKYESGRTLGRNSTCWTKPINSWWRWLVHCSYCFCLCDEQGPKSDRYVNLRLVQADIQNNKVVTGLRLVKHNRIMHLQIQEGKLLPYGYIDNATVRWVPVDDYNITDSRVYNDKDYYTMTYESRQMALDDLELTQNNAIVTGVRFQFIDGKLRFQIYANEFDWKTGIVYQNKGKYIYNEQGGK